MADGYYFFLSYARGDRDEDKHGAITKFHDDLVSEISVRRGLERESVGFYDANDIEPGDRWSERLAQGLSTSRAFVPILSPRYFDRPYCGKEWTVFSQRLAAEQNLIHPVLLVGPQYLDPLPEAVAPYQYTHGSFPTVYGEEGLRYLVRLSMYRDDYERLIAAFATKLISAVQAHVLQPMDAIPKLDAVESAFHQPGTQLAATSSETSSGGPRFVQFVFVAAKKEELGALRQSLESYGNEGGLDWKPYLPDLSDEVAIIAQDVASQEKLRYEAVELGPDLIERLEDALERQKIVVVVVDTWTTRLEPYRALMQQLDGRDFHNCVIVIPWNDQDLETAGARDVLRKAVHATFLNKVAKPDPDVFVDSIRSAEELKAELATKLKRAQARIVGVQEVLRSAETDQVFHEPVLVLRGRSSTQ